VIVMVSNQSGIEVGLLAGRNPGRIGHLYSPGGQCGPWPEIPYALDNGAWSAFKNKLPWDAAEWRELLRWAVLSGQSAQWAVVPDVVGNRTETLERWREFAPEVRRMGFRPAFAAQDGMTFADVPDSECIIFLGGGTEWKEEAIGPWCARFRKRVHVARVNTWHRLVACWRAGAISVDGTGWFHHSNSKSGGQRADLRKFLRETAHQPIYTEA
jgi:hypothetical protein